MGKPKAPKAPDYAAAATAQGAANVEAARTSARLSNPNFTNPYGSRTVNFGGNDTVSIVDSLSPLGQKRFDQEERINAGLGQVAEDSIGRVGHTLGTQFDMSKVGDRPDLANTLSRDQMTQSLIDRNQPAMDRRRQQMETQLSNQGLFRGSEGYKAAQEDLAREENDFRLSAIQAGGQEQSRQYGLESDARSKDIQTEAYLRSLPLNEITSLLSGSQVGMPQFQAYQGQDIAPPPIFGAAQAQDQANLGRYNAKMAGRSSMLGGLFSLGGVALGGGLFSDVRLKENVRRVGQTEAGLPIYTYNYIGNPTVHMGVMAQEVETVFPDAVMTHESGYKMVDYSKVQ
jgi:hypothetical protein